jgi:hypothetical protein
LALVWPKQQQQQKVSWHIPVIPALGWRLKDGKFKTSLGYIARPWATSQDPGLHSKSLSQKKGKKST